MHLARSSWLLVALLPLLGCHRERGAGPVLSAGSSAAIPALSAVAAPVAEDAGSPAAADEPFQRSEPILALGRAFSCFIDRTGLVHCWGGDDVGQRGGEGLTGALSLGAGPQHACALREDGGVLCWGDNRRGQLGKGRTVDGAVEILMAKGASALACGEAHTCAAFPDDRVVCWGADEAGQSTVPLR